MVVAQFLQGFQHCNEKICSPKPRGSSMTVDHGFGRSTSRTHVFTSETSE
jgi:hypothetical protein